VLWDFDGRTWTAPRFFYGTPSYQTTDAPVEYEVTIEPHSKRWLFALELPAQVPPNSRLTGDFQLISNTPVTSRLRYGMVSYPNMGYGIAESRMALRRALQLPPGFNPRTIELAQSLRRQFADDQALIAEVLSMFRNQKFFYTTVPPLLGTNSVDEFLFDTRRGFCEHYASAFAVLMRAAGIPARIVTGYQGGEINPVGNYMIVRQADAHAWTEVWLHDKGWTRVDPTAAVSPLRVESGIAAAVPSTDPLPLMVRGDYPWLRKLRLDWDSIANNWNQWVLGYNPERQRHLLSRAGIEDANWRTLAVILMAASGLITLTLALLMLRKFKTAVHDPARRAYRRFCAKLARKNLPRDPAEGPLDYAARLSRLRPDLAAAASAITRLYVALRYGTEANIEALHDLERRVRQFRT
jgi:transglutaminase-like putative cysteine protease